MLVFAGLMQSDAPFLSRHAREIITAGGALPSLEAVEHLPRGDQDVTDSIDVISEGAQHLIVAGRVIRSVRFNRTAALVVDGWAIDARTRRPAAAVAALIDGRAIALARTGPARPDVANAMHNVAYVASGFHLEIPAALVAPGRHRLSFLVVDAQRDATVLAGANYVIDAQRNGPT